MGSPNEMVASWFSILHIQVLQGHSGRSRTRLRIRGIVGAVPTMVGIALSYVFGG